MERRRFVFVMVIIAATLGIAIISFFTYQAVVNPSEPGGFSEVYFEDYDKFPNVIEVGTPSSFSFTVVSHNPAVMDYLYSVSMEGVTIDEGSLKVEPEMMKTVLVEYSPESPSLVLVDKITETDRLLVDFREVSNDNGTIFYPLDILGAANTGFIGLHIDKVERFNYSRSVKKDEHIPRLVSEPMDYYPLMPNKTNPLTNFGYNLIQTEWELLNTYGQITVLRSATTTKYKYQYNNVSVQVFPDDGMTHEIHFWVIVKE